MSVLGDLARVRERPEVYRELLPTRFRRAASWRPLRADFHSVCPTLNFRGLWRWNSQTSAICGVPIVHRRQRLCAANGVS
jgi:hypothetical protein